MDKNWLWYDKLRMKLPGLVARLLHREPAVPVTPTTPEGSQQTQKQGFETTTFRSGAAEFLEGAEIARKSGKPVTDEILRETAKGGITTTSEQKG